MVDKDLIDRFNAKWVEDKASGCWLWTASLGGPMGYGQIKLSKQPKRRPEYAHRVSYMIFHGEIPEGGHICHRCDNPKCVNPEHLFLGSHAINNADKVAKGRGRGGSSKGETNPSAKLTAEDVRQIRKLLSAGLSQRRVAEVYQVSSPLISMIDKRKLWDSLDPIEKE